MLSVGEQFGHYRVLSDIGEGGMGRVYLAEDIKLGRQVALKVLLGDFARDRERTARFLQEAKAASALNHPNIITIHEVGTVNGLRFIATEHIEGVTLRDLLRSSPPRLAGGVDIIVQAATALQKAHSAKIVHRDIKPENIMVRDDGLVKVLDFGLAKLGGPRPSGGDSQTPTLQQVKTRSGMILGTVAYMSPEQARGKPVDGRTDIFSLGVVAYEMLTGQRPFAGESDSDVIAAILMREPPDPSSVDRRVPLDLDRIVRKMLSKDLRGRYQAADEVLADLKSVSKHLDFATGTARMAAAGPSDGSRTKILPAATGVPTHAPTELHREAASNRSGPAGTVGSPMSARVAKIALTAVGAVLTIILGGYLVASLRHAPGPNGEAAALYSSGVEALRDGTYLKASKLLEAATKSDKDFMIARARLAEAWLELDYQGRAQSEMLRVRDLQRAGSGWLNLLSTSTQDIHVDAINAIIVRDFPAAIRAYETVVKNNPEDPQSHLDLGRAFEKNDQIDKALEAYQKASHMNPQYGAAFLRSGVLHSRRGEYERAAASFAMAESIYDRFSNDEGVAEVKFQRGVSLNAQDQLEPALEQFNQVVNIPRANVYQKIRAKLQMSSILCSQGKTDAAEALASDAISAAQSERMENLATAGLIDLGNAFFTRERYDEAERRFRQALDFARRDEGRRSEARALLALASLYVQLHKADEALQSIEQALPLYEAGGYNKEISQAYILRGLASTIKVDFAQASQSFERVLEIGGTSERALAFTGLGTVAEEQEEYVKALRYFEESENLYASIGNPYHAMFSKYNIASVEAKLGNLTKAAEMSDSAESLLDAMKLSQPSLIAKFRLLRARIALSEGKFDQAADLTTRTSPVEEEELAAEISRTLAEARVLGAERKAALHASQVAVNAAEKTQLQRLVNLSKLTLAQAYLIEDEPARALQAASQASDYFSVADQKDSAWKSRVVVAQACLKLSRLDEAKEHISAGSNILSAFKAELGTENFRAYTARADIRHTMRQMEEVGIALQPIHHIQ